MMTLRTPFKSAYFKNIREVLRNAELLSRGSGRTNAIIDEMKDGDILVAHNPEWAIELRHRIGPRKNVNVLWAKNLRELHQLMVMHPRTSSGIIHIDHHLMDILRDEALNNLETTVNIFRFRNQPFAG